MGERARLGRVAGITIGANWSLFVIAGLLTWILADTTLPAAAPHYGVGTVLIAASNDADLLVLGSRGRGGLAGLLLGSVS